MRRPHVLLAESHRAIALGREIMPSTIHLQVGARGWRNMWLGLDADGRRLVVIDDGSRLDEILWAVQQFSGSRFGVAFTTPLSARDVPLPKSDISRLSARFGWKRSRIRGLRLGFECRVERLTIPRLSLMRWVIAGRPDPTLASIGGAGAAWLGLDGASVPFEPGWAGRLGEVIGRGPELVLVDDDPGGWATDAVVTIVDEARALGSRVVAVNSSAKDDAWMSPPKVDTEITIDPTNGSGDRTGPGVDIRKVNPAGFVREADAGAAAITTHPTWQRLAQTPDGWMPYGQVEVLDGASVAQGGSGDPRSDPSDLIALLRRFNLVLDDPSLHPSDSSRARILSILASAGIPVAATAVGPELSQLLGPETSALLAGIAPDVLFDFDERERFSVELRRAAMRELSGWSRLRELQRDLGLRPLERPSVSVVMATRRPSYLEHALSQLEAQTYPDLEVVLALHGPDFPLGVEGQVAEVLGRPVEVVRSSEDLNLGEVLNVAVERSSGDLVSKWDDDDWYSAEHIWDLVLAMEYSGVDAVGKAAEFVYLADLDVTIRRFPDGADTVSRTLAGGTLTLDRRTLNEIGGYPPQPRFVDQGLLSRLVDAGGIPFRTHGFGYLLNRHGAHTWSVETDYFLDASFRQWRGLRLDEAGCIPATSLAPEH